LWMAGFQAGQTGQQTDQFRTRAFDPHRRRALRTLLTGLGYYQSVNFCFIDEESTYEYLCDPGY
jgi:hypothetical protein